MIVTTAILDDSLSEFSNKRAKIQRLVARGELIPIRRGLYETDAKAPGRCLAGSIYRPSYLSSLRRSHLQ